MEIKIKILKIIPYWLLSLILLLSALAMPNLAVFTAASGGAQPEVLGAGTEAVWNIRGALNGTAAITAIKQIAIPDTSNINAKSFLVFDLANGQELLTRNQNQKSAIASLTKLMTALVAYENLDLNHNFTIGNADTLNIKPSLNLLPGDKVKILDIFNAMLVGSCNDAAEALANGVSSQTGQNFVQLMNNEAATLKMTGTNFSNPQGFDLGQNYSTAEDLKPLIQKTQGLSVFANLGRRTGYEFAGSLGRIYSTAATNTLIKNHPDIMAIKTGYTTEANGAMATKILFAGRQVVILVINSGDREGDTLKLKNILTSDFAPQ